jgi:hypothetical protein
MRHSKILMAAMAAGLGGSVTLMAPSDIERDLYAYARERKFPPPETLARNGRAEIAGGHEFPVSRRWPRRPKARACTSPPFAPSPRRSSRSMRMMTAVRHR